MMYRGAGDDNVSSESSFELEPARVRRHRSRMQNIFCKILKNMYNFVFVLAIMAFIIWLTKTINNMDYNRSVPNFLNETTKDLNNTYSSTFEIFAGNNDTKGMRSGALKQAFKYFRFNTTE